MKQRSPLQQALQVEQEDGRVRLAGADVWVDGEVGSRKLLVTRVFPLDDIHIRKDGDGRTVDAYALVFNTPAEIQDQDGHYMEQNDPRCLAKTLTERQDKIFCLYNHGKTLGGSPSDVWSVPIGVPVGMRTDARGWFTSTRYNKDPEADRILEAIKSGSLRGMSYTGVFVRSSPELKSAWQRYQPDREGNLPLVTRLEIAPIEYGPTPIPAFDEAQVVGVRNRVPEMTCRDYYRMGRADAILHSRGSGGSPPPHHTPTTDANWDPDAQLAQLKSPLPWDQMRNMFALVDDDSDNDDGSFDKGSGHIPHHDVDPHGLPGPANINAVRSGLDQINGSEGYEIAGFDNHDKRKAIAHLNVHLQDHHGFQPPINEPPAGQAPVGSSGRQPDGEDHMRYDEDDDMTERAGASGKNMVTTYKKAPTPKVIDPDNDGDNDATPAGDTDHDYWSDDGKQLKTLPGQGAGNAVTGQAQGKRKAPPKPSSPDGDDWDDSDSRAGDAPGNGKKPYGNVTYADPKNGKYPIDTKEHAQAAWSYINKPKNAGVYPLNGVSLGSVKAKIKAAAKKFGIQISEDAKSSSGRRPGISEALWNADRVWQAGRESEDPAEFYRTACAGRRKGDPRLQSAWALPHHEPGEDGQPGPVSPEGVRNGLTLLPNLHGLINVVATEAHLRAHLRQIEAASGKKEELGS